MNKLTFHHISIFLFVFLCLFAQPELRAQKKTTATKAGTKKETTSKDTDKATSSSIPVEQLDQYREQAAALVGFLQNTLNFLADKRNLVKEKEVIINESYLKVFWDKEVQIEDDLDDKRLVPLYKDVQAYLTDVDFFFKGARFDYQIQDISVKTNYNQQTFFYVTANRSLKAVTVDGDSLNSNKVRYFEMNYDENKKELKIVSIYTTKLNEKEDLRNWWNALSQEWKEFLGKGLMIEGGTSLSNVESFNDTIAIIDGIPLKVTDSRIYGHFLRIIDSKEIDLSNQQWLSTLEPLAKMSALVSLNISGTPVEDIVPLRNLNALESFKCSGTKVSSLEPLKYCTHIKNIDLSKTPVSDLNSIVYFRNLEILNIGNTAISDLGPLKEASHLKELRCDHTRVSDLSPIASLTKLEIIDFSSTPVASADVLRELTALTQIFLNKTSVASLDAFIELPALKGIYCDETAISKQNAIRFMLDHPGVVVIFDSKDLEIWWNSLSGDWRKVFSYFVTVSNPPTKEQLHSMMTIDSVNIDGRSAITSLAPVAVLPQLRTLICSNTSVTGFEPLKDLTLIRYINANNSKVTGLQGLSGLQKLETLLVNNTQIKSLQPVFDLKGLRLIEADNTGLNRKEVADYNDKHPECLVVFQTYENSNWWKLLPEAWMKVFASLADVTGEPDKYALQRIAGMETLSIEQNPDIYNIQPVLYLNRLKTLRFSDTRIGTLEPLRSMNWLKSLSFPKNPILDLTPIGGLTGLTELDMENTQVEDLSPITNLTNLEVLRISGSQVKNLKAIGQMKNLKVLDLFNTRITNIDILDQLPELQTVKMFNTRVSEKRVEKFKMMHPGIEVVYY